MLTIPRTEAGNMTCQTVSASFWGTEKVSHNASLRIPPVGNHPVAAAIITSMSDKKTTGIERPRKEKNPIALSSHLPRFTADMTPSGIASPHEMTSAATDSTSVFRSLCHTSVQTGVEYRNESPKLP